VHLSPKGLRQEWTGEQELEVTTDFDLLRSRLESEQTCLIEKLEQLKASARQARQGQVGSYLFSKKEEDLAVESFDFDNCLALQKRIADHLTGVEYALHKFEKGTYGLCDKCGQLIDPARLEALPMANLCLSCKAQEGKKQMKTGKVLEIHPNTRMVHHSRDPRFSLVEGWTESFEAELDEMA